jgi:pyruvate,water dikinase
MNNTIASGYALGASTTATGTLKIIRQSDDVDDIEEGELAYISMEKSKFNDVLLFYSLIRAGVGGILCEDIGRTSHGIVLVNEFGIPCLTDINSDIASYEWETITVFDDTVVEGSATTSGEDTVDFTGLPNIDTSIRINLGFPEVIDARRDLMGHIDGVGFMRMEFLLLDVLNGVHPEEYLRQSSESELTAKLASRIEPVVELLGDNPVWIRTNDFSVPQLHRMDGGELHETPEKNPMLGWRGIARSIEQETLLKIEFEALRRIANNGHENMGVFPPMTRFSDEFREWKIIAHDVGLEAVDFGMMVETPSAALTFEEFANAIDFMIFGSNDLTQFTLAIDRGNANLQSKYDEKELAVQKLMKRVIQICNNNDIESSIGGQAAADPELITQLLEFGIDGFSISPNSETVQDVTEHIHSLQ